MVLILLNIEYQFHDCNVEQNATDLGVVFNSPGVVLDILAVTASLLRSCLYHLLRFANNRIIIENVKFGCPEDNRFSYAVAI